MKYLALDDVDVNIIENAMREYKDNHKNDILGQFKQVKVQKQIDAAAIIKNVTLTKCEVESIYFIIKHMFDKHDFTLDVEKQLLGTFLNLLEYAVTDDK